ncbi:hypothetical protein GCM10011504_27200 [Siccirubricoccus deserti]|uniref:IcmF-related N-terminal domain-containing protein n=1 Tax=Siccirubricoccus deserti TaxID=2013562 RepID=A0A9X0QYJ5_9PROT|nr:hypothetical protein [Siccirubricoccus deserti]MBC4016356.1 hypothetical protein [Siccirubricoccus deserti]GGC47329.1 hypothetical protein GCM10011504_27200 [Siccirubricoccus deserti]
MRTALAIGHWRLVMGEIRATLMRRGQALSAGETQAPAPPGGAPELRELRRFLGETLLLERYVQTFNRLGVGGGTMGLAELLHYTHGIELPAAYVDRAAELGFAELPSAAALRGATVEAGAQPIDAAILRGSLQSRLLVLAQSYLARQVPPPDSLDLQRQAAARLANLAEADGPDAADRVQAAAEALEAGLAAARRDAPGLVAEGVLGGSEFQALLRVVSDSRLLGPTVRDALLRAAQAPAGAEAAVTVDATGIGPLLVAAPERNRLEPAAAATALQGQFAALLARPFMRAVAQAAAPAARPALFRWNIPALEAAAALVDDHALFQLRDLPEFPAPLRSAVQRAAEERLAAGLVAAVAQAQLPAEGRDLAPVAAAARAAHPVLLRLVVALRAGAAPDDAAALAGMVTQQAQRLLAAGWAQLEAGAGYQPPPSGQLVWTEGKLDPAALYGLADAAMLPALLGRERERLHRLAELAQPMLDVLAAPELGEPRLPAIAARWRGLAEELQRASQGRAGSLAGLERMIGQDLAAVTPGNCADLPARGGGDWFTDQAVRLHARLRSLCQVQTATRAAGAWEALDESFTRLLAGRYPFAPLSAAERGPHATAERVAEFYSGFEDQAKAALAALPGDPALAARARRFIEQMRQARGLLKPLLGLDGVEPGLVLVPRFRALPERETGGDAVIEWRLIGRGVTTGTMSGQRPVPWKLGDPLILSLRWARNAPVQPVQLLPAGPRAEAGTITVTARDPWALITLARRLAPTAGDWQPGPGDSGPMLALRVQTAEAGEPPRATTPAMVFASLGITAQAAPAGPRLALPSIPTDWPVAAPRAILATTAP